ncbi:MAG: response regulator transcription factor [Acidobacteriota bacterium]|nr:response regulator transcription factor [Acidobacteriota bacterium]
MSRYLKDFASSSMQNHDRAIPIAIAAEEPIVRYGVRKLLEAEADLTVVGEAATSPEAIRLAVETKPRVLLLEMSTSLSGLEVLTRLASMQSSVRTLLLASPHDKSEIAEAFGLGARGVVLKGSATRLLLAGIRCVIEEQYWIGERAVAGVAAAVRNFAEKDGDGRKASRDYRLTPRELEIIAVIATGCTNKDAGQKFSISERTVKHHLTNIYDKLGVSTRLELALFAMNHRLDVCEPARLRARVALNAKYAAVL